MENNKFKFLGKFPQIYREDLTIEDIEEIEKKLAEKNNTAKDENEDATDIIQEFLDTKENLHQEPIFLNKDKDVEKYEQIQNELIENYLKNEKESRDARIARHLTGSDHIDDKILDLANDIVKYENEIQNLINKRNGLLPSILEENTKKIEYLKEKIEKIKRLISEFLKIQSDLDFEIQEGIGPNYKDEKIMREELKEEQLEKLKREN